MSYWTLNHKCSDYETREFIERRAYSETKDLLCLEKQLTARLEERVKGLDEKIKGQQEMINLLKTLALKKE